MKKTETKTKLYCVYLHKCPDGRVFIGTTSGDVNRRWQNGHGYKGTDFYEAVRLFGWDNIIHKKVVEGIGREEAKRWETNLVAATDERLRFNKVGEADIHDGWFIREVLPKAVELIGESMDVGIRLLFTETDEREIIEQGAQLKDCFGIWEETNQQKQSNMKRHKKEKQMTIPANAIDGVKVEIVLDTRYQHKSGGYPVCIRIAHRSRYRYIKTGYVMNTDEFREMHPKDCEKINDIRRHYCEQVRACGKDNPFNLDMTLKEYTPLSGGQGTLADLIREKMGMLDNAGSAQNYKSAINKLYEVYPNGLPLCDVSATTIGKYKSYMEGLGMSNTTINIYLSMVKASINYGIYKKYIGEAQYPFKRKAVEIDKVSMPKANKRDMEYLPKEDIQKIWDYFMTSKRVSRELGYFLFSYLHGGMNLADMMFLTFNDFYFNEGGFCFKRRKTEKKNDFNVIVPVTNWTEQLLERMGIEPKHGECVFKRLQCDGSDESYQKIKRNHSTYINRVLEKVCPQIGVRTVSMTAARHSFATIATKEKISYTMIEQCMGHANNAVSSHYIGGWDVNEMRDEFERLL